MVHLWGWFTDGLQLPNILFLMVSNKFDTDTYVTETPKFFQNIPTCLSFYQKDPLEMTEMVDVYLHVFKTTQERFFQLYTQSFRHRGKFPLIRTML